MNLFQITNILETYISENPPPDWLLKGVRELAWIFKEYPYTSAYFNTASEVAEIFIIDRAETITSDDIGEVNFTRLATPKVLTLLEDALIIRRENGNIYPGALVEKLRQVRWEGYKMDTPQIEDKLLELHGILTVTLIQAMITERTYMPHRALGVFSILSQNILNSGDDDIQRYISKYHVELAYATAKVGNRQQRRINRMMLGFSDGKTKLISDITHDGQMEFKDSMVNYMSIMRTRYRERARERVRE